MTITKKRVARVPDFFFGKRLMDRKEEGKLAGEMAVTNSAAGMSVKEAIAEEQCFSQL
ncbi:MAG: hypothetical protein ABR577_16610 [Pyrinomonadaceae bacterium]